MSISWELFCLQFGLFRFQTVQRTYLALSDGVLHGDVVSDVVKLVESGGLVAEPVVERVYVLLKLLPFDLQQLQVVGSEHSLPFLFRKAMSAS